MKMARWFAGSLAALGLLLAFAPTHPAQAMSPASPGLLAAVKDTTTGGVTQVRFHGGGHFHGGGFHRFHGGFRPRFYGGYGYGYGYNPYYAYTPYYYAPLYRCPVVWTAYGPRRICAYRRHHVRYWRAHRYHRHLYRYHHYHRRWM